MLPFSLALVLFALLTSPAAAGEQSACSLLTSSDIEAVVGGKPTAAQPLQFDDIPTGKQIVKVDGCFWKRKRRRAHFIQGRRAMRDAMRESAEAQPASNGWPGLSISMIKRA